MNAYTASRVIAMRNHLSERLCRLDPAKDGDEIAETSRQIRLLEAVVNQPQLESLLRTINAQRMPGYIALLGRLGCAAGPGMVVRAQADATPAKASWWHVCGRVAYITGEIIGGADEFIEATGDIEEIRINSPGGCSRIALQIAEAFSGRRVKAVVTGRCYSAAVDFLLLGEPRLIERNAKIMVHTSRNYALGSPRELRDAAMWLEANNAKIISFYTKRTGWPEHTVRQWFDDGKDHYFTAQEAVSLGFADEIYDAPPAPKLATADIESPATLGNESLFLQWLAAFGTVKTADRNKLFRELQAWSAYNIKTV